MEAREVRKKGVEVRISVKSNASVNLKSSQIVTLTKPNCFNSFADPLVKTCQNMNTTVASTRLNLFRGVLRTHLNIYQ